MKLRSLIFAASVLVGLAMSATAASALTISELYDTIGGLQCGGSTCTLDPTTVDNIVNANAATEITFVNGAPGFVHTLGHFVPSSLIGNEGNPASCTRVTSTETLTIGFDPTPVIAGDNWSLTSSVSSVKSSC